MGQIVPFVHRQRDRNYHLDEPCVILVLPSIRIERHAEIEYDGWGRPTVFTKDMRDKLRAFAMDGGPGYSMEPILPMCRCTVDPWASLHDTDSA